MRKIIVASLHELEKAVVAHSGGHEACFRGQRNSRWKLIPSAFRPFANLPKAAVVDVAHASQVERDTYREFDSTSRGLLDRHLPVIEQIAFAQHYGVPTRFLDWTSDVRVAAFFATLSPDTTDAAVWSLDLHTFPFPGTLGRQHRGGGFLPEKVRHYCGKNVGSFAQPVSELISASSAHRAGAAVSPLPAPTFLVVHPPRECSRLLQQSGLLSWYHTFDESELVWDYSSHIASLERSHKVDLLSKFVIPKGARKAIREDLRRARVTPFMLFPDLDGLGRDLAEIHAQAMGNAVFRP